MPELVQRSVRYRQATAVVPVMTMSQPLLMPFLVLLLLQLQMGVEAMQAVKKLDDFW